MWGHIDTSYDTFSYEEAHDLYAVSVFVKEEKLRVLYSTITKEHNTAKSSMLEEEVVTGLTSFNSLWKTNAANETIDLILEGGYSYNFTIDWGDGSAVETITNTNPTHTYTTAGEYTIEIEGDFPVLSIGFNSRPKLKEITQWGDIQWATFADAFKSCYSMQLTATDTPNLSNVTDMSGMFADTNSFNGNISTWNVGNVTDMSGMFSNSANFNGDISTWNVSNVTDMSGMFSFAGSFNKDLSTWNVSNVTDMSGMFQMTRWFNGDISTWNVSNVIDMSSMFNMVGSFNGDVSSWDVSNVTNMSHMFSFESSFNGDISTWNVSNVTDMSSMFDDSQSFNGDLSSWDVGNVTDMSMMFGSTVFNGDISPWDVSNVTNMSYMFAGTASFNRDLSTWDVGNATDMEGMFNAALSFNGDISAWNVSNVTDMSVMFQNTRWFNGDLSTWNVSNVTNMSRMFGLTDSFNGDLSTWNVGNVTDMSSMFYFTQSFNGDISAWNVSNVTNMDSMFRYASSFNRDLSSWNLNKVNSASTMFNNSGISKKQYDRILVGWEANSNTPASINLGSVPAYFCNGEVAKLALEVKGWTISDLGKECLPFKTLWETNAANETIDLNLDSAYTYDFTIDWGDGSVVETITNTNPTHAYAAAGEYTIEIEGDFPVLSIENNSRQKLKEITQWGDIEWASLESAFEGCSNVLSRATDIPNLDNVTSLNGMFRDAISFDGNVSNWDVKNVTSMEMLFSGASAFNEDISSWNVENVSIMSGMFQNAISFNQDLSSWNVSNVILMNEMFGSASSFNQDLSSWDVSKVDNMSSMFEKATSFNGDISTWNTGNVTYMQKVFYKASSFNQNLSSWNVGNVTNMVDMFYEAISFNQDLSSWDLSKVVSLSYMFEKATAFNGDVSSWNISSVTSLRKMFSGASSFNQNLSSWNLVSVTNIGDIFKDSGLTKTNYDNTLIGWAENANTPSDLDLGSVPAAYCNGTEARALLENNNNWTISDLGQDCKSFITHWKTDVANENISLILLSEYAYNFTINWGDGFVVETITNTNPTHTYAIAGEYTIEIKGDFPALSIAETCKSKLMRIEQWGEIEWASLESAFEGCSNVLSIATGIPDLDNVTSLNKMFKDAISFDGNISNWDLKNITSMEMLFSGASSFNEDISSWNVENVSNMGGMFQNATSFNQDLSSWNVGNVIQMNDMFGSASSFNEDISSWNVENVSNMGGMFQNATSFNQDLSSWNVGNVIQMNDMFGSASAFNQDLSSWNVSKVDNMSGMFENAISYNGDVSTWNTGNVTNMNYMFSEASSFNQNLSSWNVGNVINMADMFYEAISFNQDISSWDVSKVVDLSYMFEKATAFNGDVSSWNISSVTSLRKMFYKASSFNQDLSSWDLVSVTNIEDFFKDSGLTKTNYDNTLIGWAENANMPSDLDLGTVPSEYCNGAAAKDYLIANLGWTIVDDGKNCPETLGEVVTLSALSINGVNVTLEGEIKSLGISSGYTLGMVYSYTNMVPTIFDKSVTYLGDSNNLYTVNLSNLVEGILYYYCAFITNSLGTTYGAVKQFSTGNIGGVFKKKHGFSPNGDGINDALFIDDLDEYPNNLVSVYNRSGKLVYQKKGYDNSWTGTSSEVSSGSKLPVGAYLLLLDLNDGKTTPIQAWVFLNY